VKVNQLIVRHGGKQFELSGEDEFGCFMLLEEYTIYLRKDDQSLAEGLSIAELYPLISKLTRNN
jgi:hypothetical protein